MNREERSQFVSSYSKVVTQSWADASYRQKLVSDPADVLSSAGLDVPSGVTINVVTDIQEDGELEDQIKLWEEGLESGAVTLYVPSAPQLDDGELSDSQLEAVAGGGDCCCSCTPCCTCT